MKQLLLLFFCLFSVGLCAQSGYLGALNSVGIKISVVPSIRKTHRLNAAGTEAKIRQRIGYTTFKFDYSRVISKRIELGIGYGYARAHAFTIGDYYRNYDTVQVNTNGIPYTAQILRDLNFLEDPAYNIHTFNFEFKYYRHGSLAPIGKYVGFGFNFGRTTLKPETDIYIGKRNIASKDNFLYSKHEVIELDTVHSSAINTTKLFQLSAKIGRNYPLTKQLVLSLGMDFPIITYIADGESSNFGFQLSNYNVQYQEGDVFYKMGKMTMKKFHQVSLNLALRFNF